MLFKRLSLLLMLVFSTSGVAVFADPLPCWVMLPEKSQLQFIFEQAGVDEKGVFKDFSAIFLFDPQKPDATSISVSIDMGSLDTGDADRDEILRSTDMFDVGRWPKTLFKTSKIESQSAAQYQSSAELTIRDQTRQIPFPFTIKLLKSDDGRRMFRLDSHIVIKRLNFGVGQGDWVETTWVSDEVSVSAIIYAVESPSLQCIKE